MKKIFEPVEMKNLTARNRLVRSATWEGIANPDGSIPDEAYDIYAKLAAGGVGAIITGFTSVALHDYYFDGMMRLCDDALIPQYRKLTDMIHAGGCPVIAQLALGAYYREVNGRYVQVEPDDMARDEIQRVVGQFIDAAARAEKAGFDGVQIHAAHFFFLSRFKTVSFISEETAIKQKKAVTGDIIMAVTSENIDDVCKCVAWLGEGEVAVNGHTAIIHHNQDPKYLSLSQSHTIRYSDSAFIQ